MFEGHGRVHADRNDADDGTDAQQRMNPLQRWPRVTILMPRNILNLCYEPCYLENVITRWKYFTSREKRKKETNTLNTCNVLNIFTYFTSFNSQSSLIFT